MSFGGFIASLLGLAAVKGIEATNKPKIDYSLHNSDVDTVNLPMPSFSRENTQEWIDKLQARFDAEGKVLEQLYKLIDYQPIHGSYINLRPMENYMPRLPDCYFAQYWRMSTGIERMPTIGGVCFHFGLSNISVTPFTDKEKLKKLDYDFTTPLSVTERTLKIIREYYWKPNRKRFTKWCRKVLPSLGMTEVEIERFISKQAIPVDHPSNDIIYRTPEELAYFDKVADRIVTVTEHMVEDAKNFCLISNGMDATDKFFNEELGTLSYKQRRATLKW